MYQFADGFDNYGNNYSLTNGYPWDKVNGVTVITSDYRFAPPPGAVGGCASGSGGNYLRKNLTSNQSTVIVGFGMKFTALPSSAQDFLYFWDNNNEQMGLAINSLGQLQFYRGNGQQPGSGGQPLNTAIGSASPNGTIAANTWYGFVVQITISSSNGSIACYLNGSSTPIISATGLNTSGDGNAFTNQVSVGNVLGNLNSWRADDAFFWDTTGTTNNSIPNTDTRIITKVPNAAGTYTNWVPTPSGNANWQNVSQTPPNTSDYNSNDVSGTKDSYKTPVVGISMTPLCTVVRASLWENDAQTHNPSLMIRSNGTDIVGPALPTLTSSPLFYDQLFSGLTGPLADTCEIGIQEG